MCDMSGREVLDYLYESDRLKTWIAMNACVRGMPRLRHRSGRLLHALRRLARLSIVRGGTHQIAQSLAAFFHANGGIILTGEHVEKIIIEGGRAVGVRTSEGKTFRAEKVRGLGSRPAGDIPADGGGGAPLSRDSGAVPGVGRSSTTPLSSVSTPRRKWRPTTRKSTPEEANKGLAIFLRGQHPRGTRPALGGDRQRTHPVGSGRRCLLPHGDRSLLCTGRQAHPPVLAVRSPRGQTRERRQDLRRHQGRPTGADAFPVGGVRAQPDQGQHGGHLRLHAR